MASRNITIFFYRIRKRIAHLCIKIGKEFLQRARAHPLLFSFVLHVTRTTKDEKLVTVNNSPPRQPSATAPAATQFSASALILESS